MIHRWYAVCALSALGILHTWPAQVPNASPHGVDHSRPFVRFDQPAEFDGTRFAAIRPGIHDTATAGLDTAAILSSARADIDAANAAWLPGLRNHDASSLAAAYADSGLFVAANGAVTRGRAAVAQLYASRFPHQRPIRAGGVVTDGVAVVSPTRVVEWGHAWVDFAPPNAGEPSVRSSGEYLTIWTREADGHWRISRNLTF